MNIVPHRPSIHDFLLLASFSGILICAVGLGVWSMWESRRAQASCQALQLPSFAKTAIRAGVKP